MSDVVNKLWGFCNILKQDGVGYTDYIEQLTYLLFLKMSDEKGVHIPKQYCWAVLRDKSGKELSDFYIDLLRGLGNEKGKLGEIYSNALSKFRNPVNLKKLISLIDEIEWTGLNVDVKAAAYEGLLEKAASEGKKGTGGYFTPRVLIQSIVRLMKPDPRQTLPVGLARKTKDFTMHDPACGTGGFLVCAFEWLMKITKRVLERDESKRITYHTYSGTELVDQPKRLCLMNLYLHGIEGNIYYGDSIYEPPKDKHYDCILTNPPFGTKGANQAPVRDDFIVSTSNKQLNFIQHIMSILKPGGRAAVVLPDNVLFEEHAAADIFEILMEDCNLHTIMRLPNGTFAPYAQGVKANVIFFTKGTKTDKIWIYDNRTNIPGITKKDRPLTPEHFAEFEKCFGSDPNGHPKKPREETERFKCFTREEIKKRENNLDITWLKEENPDGDEIREPEELVADATKSLRTALTELEKLTNELGNRK